MDIMNQRGSWPVLVETAEGAAESRVVHFDFVRRTRVLPPSPHDLAAGMPEAVDSIRFDWLVTAIVIGGIGVSIAGGALARYGVDITTKGLVFSWVALCGAAIQWVTMKG